MARAEDRVVILEARSKQNPNDSVVLSLWGNDFATHACRIEKGCPQYFCGHYFNVHSLSPVECLDSAIVDFRRRVRHYFGDDYREVWRDGIHEGENC